MSIAMIRALADYHAALHRRVWESVMRLSDAQFVAPAPYAHGSVRDQLIHLATVEGRWLRGLRGEAQARAYGLDPADYPTREAARAICEATTRALAEHVAALDEAVLAASPPGLEEPAWQVLLHLVLHGVDHRAQVLRLLHEHGAPTFNQDFIIYLWGQRGASAPGS